MATGGEGQLTKNQIVRLGRAISSRDMESIALGYLDIEEETIKNFRDARRDNLEAFNRDIIRHWICKNPEPNQVQVCKNCFGSQSFWDIDNLQQLPGVEL